MSGKQMSALCALGAIIAGSFNGLLALDPFLPPPVAQPDQIAARWSAQYGTIRHVIDFKKDFTFAGKKFVGEVLADEYSGIWYLSHTVEGDILSYTYTESKLIPRGVHDKDKLVGFTGDTFSVLTADKHVRYYQRLSQEESK
jgi:hypothetical protein